MDSTATPGCRWSCYGAPCGADFVNADQFCETHAKMRCGLCGGPSDTGCDNCGQFVCGAPVCTRCGSMCKAHGGTGKMVLKELEGLEAELEVAIFDAMGKGGAVVQDATEAVLEVLEKRSLIAKGQAKALAHRIERKAQV